jgi:hypothetical protein
MTSKRYAWLALPIHAVICGAFMLVDSAFIFGNVFDGIGTVVEIFVVASATTIGVLLVGLPLRIIPPLRRFWIRHSVATLIAVAVSLAVVVLAWFVGGAGMQHYPSFEGQPAFDSYAPDWPLSIVGWFALAFTTAHAWWPSRQASSLGSTRNDPPPKKWTDSRGWQRAGSSHVENIGRGATGHGR